MMEDRLRQCALIRESPLTYPASAFPVVASQVPFECVVRERKW